jgi:hypothetical protein
MHFGCVSRFSRLCHVFFGWNFISGHGTYQWSFLGNAQVTLGILSSQTTTQWICCIKNIVVTRCSNYYNENKVVKLIEIFKSRFLIFLSRLKSHFFIFLSRTKTLFEVCNAYYIISCTCHKTIGPMGLVTIVTTKILRLHSHKMQNVPSWDWQVNKSLSPS